MLNEENANTNYRAVENKAPRQDQIRERAHAIWQENGCLEGCDLDNWLQAEEEIAGGMVRVSAA